MPITFLDPRGEVADRDEPYRLGVDLAAGSPVIALLANGFPDSGEFMDAVGAALAGLVPGAQLRRYGKASASAPASDDLLKEIAAECGAAVTAYGH